MKVLSRLYAVFGHHMGKLAWRQSRMCRSERGDSIKKYFVVTSYGRTATYWLAFSLNKHPDIVCSHGRLPITSYGERQARDAIVYEHENESSLAEKSIDDLFDELEEVELAKVYGNVLGYDAYSLLSKLTTYKPKRVITIINLTRHPITRIESLGNEWCYEFTFSPTTHQRVQEMRHQNKVVFDVMQSNFPHTDFSVTENSIFLSALLNVIRSDVRELRIDDVLHVPMERMTKDVEYFCWMLGILTQKAINIESSYLYDVISSGRKNQHSKAEKSSIEQYELWDEWKRVIFKVMLDAHKAEGLYERFGYDLSFVR